jgi:hypothetical protein
MTGTGQEWSGCWAGGHGCSTGSPSSYTRPGCCCPGHALGSVFMRSRTHPRHPPELPRPAPPAAHGQPQGPGVRQHTVSGWGGWHTQAMGTATEPAPRERPGLPGQVASLEGPPGLCRVQGPGSRVQGPGSRVQGPGSKVQGPGSSRVVQGGWWLPAASCNTPAALRPCVQ